MPKLGTKILIIDYEPRGIKQLNDPLEGAGFEITVAKDGIAGLEVFGRESFDLVLVEAMLPKRHGFEVCQELKRTERGQRTPVVIVTSVYKGRKYRSQAFHQHGCDEYLEKPVSPEKLLETVKQLLERAESAAATEPGAAQPLVTEPAGPPDTAESEIADRLDQIFGGPDGTSGGPGSTK